MRNYIRVQLIGGGGFADIWRAVLDGTQEEYAVKMLRDYRDPDARHRFEREVRMLQGLQHPRVIRIVAANTTAAEPFYVMPLMRGGALTSWAGHLPPESIRTILLQLADFLAYLHSQGGLHRDIKPDNLLVDAAGNFAVGDFGLGNNPNYTVMMTAHAAGTWGYIAPELTRQGGQATPATDIYSVGATMFHLATGVHPKDSTSLDPWSVRADVPLDIRNLILQMVNPVPSLRPSATALRDALTSHRRPAPNMTAADRARAPSPWPLTSPRLPAPDMRESDDGLKALVGFGLLVFAIAAFSSSRS